MSSQPSLRKPYAYCSKPMDLNHASTSCALGEERSTCGRRSCSCKEEEEEGGAGEGAGGRGAGPGVCRRERARFSHIRTQMETNNTHNHEDIQK